MNISEWQQEFRRGPRVWATWYTEDGIQELSNLYESEEAAQFEVEFRKRTKQRVPAICYINIHSLKLSEERWSKK